MNHPAHSLPIRRVEPILYPEHATELPVRLAEGEYNAGTLLQETSETGVYAYYNNDVTASQARLINQYACTVDSAGNITFAGAPGIAYQDAPAWMSGTFRTEELRGIDQAALDDLNATIVQGTLASGIVRI